MKKDLMDDNYFKKLDDGGETEEKKQKENNENLNKNIINKNVNPMKRFGMAKPPTLKNFKIPKPAAPPVIHDETDIYNNTNISENDKNEGIDDEEP